MSSVNYARYDGIYKSELPGAIVMAAIYAPLFLLNVFRSIRHPTYVLIVLAFFCLIRVVAFTLRAILAGSDSAGENISLLIAEQIIYSVGFFGLLYSAYTLVLDRMQMLQERHTLDGPIALGLRIIKNRRVIRLVLTVAIALGIAAGSMSSSSNENTLNTAATLRRASVYIFLAVSAALVVIVSQLAFFEATEERRDHSARIGQQHGAVILLAIALLCLVREAFYAATVKNTIQQNNAHLWYPLSALTELLAVLLFAVPGLVPSRADIAGALGSSAGGRYVSQAGSDAEMKPLDM